MKRLTVLALIALTLEGCPSRTDIASASAIPAYQGGAQALLDRNARKPFTEAEKAAIKAADAEAFAAVVRVNDAQMTKAAELHARVQGL